MKKNRILALAVLAVMLILPTVSLAQEIQFEPVLQYLPGIVSVPGTNYLIVTGKEKQQALFSTDGEQLTPYEHKNLSYLSRDYFVAYDEDGDNTRMLMDVSGVPVTEAAYGGFKVYSRKWAVGYVLSPADEESGDYKRGNAFFRIERCDLFYLGGEPSLRTPAASLTPDQLTAVGTHGDFIALQNAEEKITLHDKDFSVCELEMEKVSSPVYGVDEYYAVVNLITGQTVANGFVSVKEMETNRGLMFIGARYDFKGQKVSVIFDEDGNEVLPVEYTVSSISGDYAVITDKSKLKGLYCLSQSKVIVPCAYQNIVNNTASTDTFVSNGYVLVEDGELRGYVDTRTGELSCEIKYDRSQVTAVGCCMFWQVEEGVYMLAAADGVETEVHVDAINAKTRGNGYLLVAQKDGYYGLIDWHGQEVLPFIHSKIITVTDDSAAILRTSTGMEMDRIVIAP